MKSVVLTEPWGPAGITGTAIKHVMLLPQQTYSIVIKTTRVAVCILLGPAADVDFITGKRTRYN